MKKIFYILLLTACFAAAVSCKDAEIDIPEENILHVDGRIDAIGSLEGIYDYADFVVICEVTAKGDAYLKSGEALDTSLPHDRIMQKLIELRTPYEITVKESFKGSLNVGDKYTVISLEGVIDGYEVDAGLPELEVGKVYFIPICISDPEESLPYFPAVASLNDDILTPLMFDDAFVGISNTAELRDTIFDLENTKE